MHDKLRQAAIALHDRFTHEGMERRTFMARMVALAGSVAAAEALIASIAASAAAAAIVPDNDPRVRTRPGVIAVPGMPTHQTYIAQPLVARERMGAVLVVHENRGLNDHIRDVARRLAVAGYYAVAPDYLSLVGGTPANEDAAREAIGKLDVAQTITHAVGHVDVLRGAGGLKKVGAVGFCWGGAFVNRLAVAAGDKLDAAVPFYGPAPDPAEASKVSAPLQLHLAGLDERVAKTAWPWVAALGSAGKAVEAFNYPGVHHAFHNDTSAERFDKAAAELAWSRTLDFFKRHLG